MKKLIVLTCCLLLTLNYALTQVNNLNAESVIQTMPSFEQKVDVNSFYGLLNSTWFKEYINKSSSRTDSAISYYYIGWDDFEDWEPYEKTLSKYDSNNNLLEVETFELPDINGPWFKNSKCEYSYDINNNKTLERCQYFNHDLNKWVGSQYEEYEYNNQSKRTMDIYYYWDTQKDSWAKSSKTFYYYDDNMNRTEDIGYSWNDEIGDWNIYRKNVFVYNENTQLIEVNSYYWNQDIGDWVVGAWKEEYLYDTPENGVEYYMYMSYGPDNWMLADKKGYTYDANNNLLERKVYHSWEGYEDWVCTYKNIYEYDVDNNMTFEGGYKYDLNINTWMNSSKTEYTYDRENILSWNYYIWDRETNEWVGQMAREYEYNENRDLSIFTMLSWRTEENNWVAFGQTRYFYDEFGELIEFINYNSGSEWHKSSKTVFNQHITTDTEELIAKAPASVIIFPNPTSETLNLKTFDNQGLIQIEIIDYTGKKVFNSKVYADNGVSSLTIPQLSTGIYFVKLIGSTINRTEKLIVK